MDLSRPALWLSEAAVLLCLKKAAAEDAACFKIPPPCTVLIAFCAFPRLLISAGGWLRSLLLGSLCCAGLLLLSLCGSALFRKRVLGGGDLKLIFALLLHLRPASFLAFFGLFCLYALETALLLKETRRLPLAPALSAAWLGSLLAEAGGITLL